jgi:hypothetical protein
VLPCSIVELLWAPASTYMGSAAVPPVLEAAAVDGGIPPAPPWPPLLPRAP